MYMEPKNMRRQFRKLCLIGLEEVREILDDEIRRRQG